MKPNPYSDVIAFLAKPGWPYHAFWVLLILSVLAAAYAFVTIPEQRRFKPAADWLIRVAIGAMWWQQTLWKLPPFYTDHPDKPFGVTGLSYWMTVMGKSAAIPAQADFVNHIVLPNFYLLAPIVYSLEVLTAVSLTLGLFVRFWGVIGALQILNLWLGLYNAPGEWPWTYFFLFVIQLIFAIHRYGRSLGFDAIIADRTRAPRGLARLFLAATT
ncbi:MAG TPA: hypothetical protein VJ770_01820 [Stellaceae bacterium]|nr:hypothetical protein [Stellaceae bacterium]